MENKPQQMFDVRLQIIRGKNLLVKRNQAYEIDEVGLSIWELCDGSHTIADISTALTKSYNVEYNQAEADCQAFVEEMLGLELLE